ncbi:ROK family protein [uncultured Amnibacterium sp.]|uniref:ROK family protein n=1 Tax=uncultured Amnibacterium sp. TaxID=1631851 RepID=UPI0035CA2F31
MAEPLALALDIGATKLAVALIGPDGLVVRGDRAPTRRDEGPQAVLDRLLDLAQRVRGDAAITAAGVACGGPLDARAGVLLGPLHLPGWDHVEIVRLVEDRFGVPAVLANDASAGAWGEFRAGAAKGAGSAVYLTISSGLGGGAVLDGRLLVGATTNGGELGHVCVRPGGRRCTCGRLGCAEAYASGTQLVERAREAMADGRASALADVDDLDAEAIVRLAADDDLAGELWAEALTCLGQLATDLVNVFEPEVLVLGGGLAEQEALPAAVRTAVTLNAMVPIRRTVRVERAALGGTAPAVGAGLLALERVA